MSQQEIQSEPAQSNAHLTQTSWQDSTVLAQESVSGSKEAQSCSHLCRRPTHRGGEEEGAAAVVVVFEVEEGALLLLVGVVVAAVVVLKDVSLPSAASVLTSCLVSFAPLVS